MYIKNKDKHRKKKLKDETNRYHYYYYYYYSQLSLLSKRKTRSSQQKQQQASIKCSKSTHENVDCQYDVYNDQQQHHPHHYLQPLHYYHGIDDPSNTNNSRHCGNDTGRTKLLLARHAQLVNTIIGQRNESSFCNHHSYLPGTPRISALPPPLPPKNDFYNSNSSVAVSNRNYYGTLATCSPRRECCAQYSTTNSKSSNNDNNTNSWSTSSKQRTRIKTNPWIHSPKWCRPTPSTCLCPTAVDYCLYDPSVGNSLPHSESYPKTVLEQLHQTKKQQQQENSPIVIVNPKVATVLHQSDSGQGFSLSSIGEINSSSSSSSPSSSIVDNSISSLISSSSDEKKMITPNIRLQRKSNLNQLESPAIIVKNQPNTNDIRSKTVVTPPLSSRIVNERKKILSKEKGYVRSPSDQTPPSRQQHRGSSMFHMTSTNDPAIRSRSSSSHSVDDHFSLQFEEIVEQCSSSNNNNKRLLQQRNVGQTPSIPGPFILPLSLDNDSLQPPLATTLTKSTNSRAILKHIQDIENEIRLMKNLDKPEEEEQEEEEEESPYSVLDIDTNDDRRNTIYEQVDLWVEKCLKTQETDINLLHNESTRLSDTIKDYMVFVCSDNEDEKKNLTLPTESNSKLMTAFYVSSTPKETILSVDAEQFENDNEYPSIKKDLRKLPKRITSMIAHDPPLPVRTPKQPSTPKQHQLSNSRIIDTRHKKSNHECPF
ncbi:unnamed protein product [Didymodactylos carnosus]|uniref:Uncharacterized protein n=1 Tax=Didymodactylos carnosus TaxID=1234261 RepID=A0A814CBM9_9BILA|nr:unnamed protein product [Didymodactylos carnosus]CAF3714842.1 unnamed protein product [Didymodactylos carnosus]